VNNDLKSQKKFKEDKNVFFKTAVSILSSTNPSGCSTPNTGPAARNNAESIDVVKLENIELKKHIEMLMQCVSLLELKMSEVTGSPHTISPCPSIASPPAARLSTRSSSGRRSIPYDLRNTKQHQNRMEYLLRKITLPFEKDLKFGGKNKKKFLNNRLFFRWEK
jgi:hypothetical protein